MIDYLTHFGLERAPFTTTPDPAFAFATREHRQALAKVAYYTEQRRGMFLLMGEVGTGKTTISQLAVKRWPPSDTSPRTSPTRRPGAPPRSCGWCSPPSACPPRGTSWT